MYTAKQFLETADKIKEKYPDFNLTTDIIVGFPGETEDDFQKSVDLAKKINFGHIHTFKYSVRTGTRAERMSDQVSEKIKILRSEIIRNISEESRLLYRNNFKGRKQKVLVEKIQRNGFAVGYGENYFPVIIKNKALKKNEFYEVVIDGMEIKDEPYMTAFYKS